MRGNTLQRVKKKSFILSTILTPLIFPIFIAITVFVLSTEESEERVIALLDSNNFIEDSTKFQNIFLKSDENISDIQNLIDDGIIYGALEIPRLDIYNPDELRFYSKNVPGGDLISGIESLIENKIRELKIQDLKLNEESLEKLRTRISMETYSVDSDLSSGTDEVGVKQSNSDVAFGLGYFNGFLIYMFVFIYGSFILQSVLDEKTSKVVEVIISSIKPTQLYDG